MQDVSFCAKKKKNLFSLTLQFKFNFPKLKKKRKDLEVILSMCMPECSVYTLGCRETRQNE